VERYFTNYDRLPDWQLVAGFVDRRPALLVRDPADPAKPPAYFILLEWLGDEIATIRDFYFARYVLDGAELVVLE
jgi:RNA polymerase sigma-70 factor (ECF subfamily)